MILITGGCGFIGKNLCWFLHRKGIPAMVMDNFSVGKPDNMPEDIEVIEGDITNIDNCRDAVGKADYVINLAGLAGVQDSYEHAAEYWQVNLVGAINILSCCLECSTDRIIMASSGAAGDPDSPYSSSKWALEYVGKESSANVVILRFANVYGPYSEHKASLIHALLRAARDHKAFVLHGTGDHSRDFIHVNDVCSAIVKAVSNNGNMDKYPYEIGTGKGTKVRDVITMVEKVTGKSINVINGDAVQEKDYNVAKTLMAAHHMGFSSKISLEDGIRMTWESMQ